MSVSEPFEPEDLAGQIEYLIDNQDVHLVETIMRLDDTRLAMQLHSGDRYIITIEHTNRQAEGPSRRAPEGPSRGVA